MEFLNNQSNYFSFSREPCLVEFSSVWFSAFIKICQLVSNQGNQHKQRSVNYPVNFDVLLHVHLSIVLVINQLNAQILVL